jgi:hypothetical protein
MRNSGYISKLRLSCGQVLQLRLMLIHARADPDLALANPELNLSWIAKYLIGQTLRGRVQ